MRFIISPAKKMNECPDLLEWKDLPLFLEEARALADWLGSLPYPEAKKLWQCNDKIAELNFQRFSRMELTRHLTPALLSYEGIQYQYMAPQVFTEQEWDYVQEHLRILSGFYGVLRPLDGVVPYRLEMQAKTGRAQVPGCTLPGMPPASLYDFWGRKLFDAVSDESRIILNLASREYSRALEPWLTPSDTFITFVFGEWKDGKIIQKGTQAKMARGEMVRFLAEIQAVLPEEARQFNRLGYRFREELSDASTYVFVKE